MIKTNLTIHSHSAVTFTANQGSLETPTGQKGHIFWPGWGVWGGEGWQGGVGSNVGGVRDIAGGETKAPLNPKLCAAVGRQSMTFDLRPFNQ